MGIVKKCLYGIQICMAVGKDDWGLIQAFVVVAEQGSLSAAARKLGVSQPTLGRQVKALEADLGAPLFERHARGFRLSTLGQSLISSAQDMATAANALSLTAAGQAHDLRGTVRITASDVVSHFLLPPVLAKLRQAAPEIALELVPTDHTENLLFHEADIAIRMYRPEQLDMVTRHVGDLALGLFASTDYLDLRGRPAQFEDILGHDMVGFDRSDLLVAGLRSAGLDVDRDWFPVRCDRQVIYWQLVRAGCGIGITQLSVGRAEPCVEQVLPEAPLPALPVWLTAHGALRQTLRVALVWEALDAALAAECRLEPGSEA